MLLLSLYNGAGSLQTQSISKVSILICKFLFYKIDYIHIWIFYYLTYIAKWKQNASQNKISSLTKENSDSPSVNRQTDSIVLRNRASKTLTHFLESRNEKLSIAIININRSAVSMVMKNFDNVSYYSQAQHLFVCWLKYDESIRNNRRLRSIKEQLSRTKPNTNDFLYDREYTHLLGEHSPSDVVQPDTLTFMQGPHSVLWCFPDSGRHYSRPTLLLVSTDSLSCIVMRILPFVPFFYFPITKDTIIISPRIIFL